MDAVLLRSQEEAAAAAAAEAATAAAAAAAAAEAAAAARAAAEDAQELQAAVALSLALEAESALAGARARMEALGAEPAAGERGAAAVRVALPSGLKLQRRFPAGATVGALVDFVVVSSAEVGESLARETFDLFTQVPRRVYATHEEAAPDVKLTLQEAGLNGATVNVKRL
jgi:hypothetical protein